LTGICFSRREKPFPFRKQQNLLGNQKTQRGFSFPAGKSKKQEGILFSRWDMAFPSGKRENPVGNRFSRQGSLKPDGNLQFLPGFGEKNE